MAYTLSENSLNKLKGIDSRLIKLVTTAILTSPIDFTVLEGLRSQQRQIDLFKNGHSQRDGIKKRSEHQLGMAVDLSPYPIDWNDKKRFKILSNHIKATAKKLGIKIVWGGDWKMVDCPHYELKY